jgi:hypothetical protein
MKAFLVGSVVVLLPVAVMASSCATVEQPGGPPADSPSPLPDASSPDSAALDAGEEPRDGGCDPSDPKCVTQVVPCEQASFCPVATGVSGFYAFTSIWGSGKNDVWVGGSGGTVVHWDGASWVSVPTPVKNTFHVVYGSGPKDVWVASSTDVIFHSKGFETAAGGSGKTTWERVENPFDQFNLAPVFAVWGTSQGDLRLGGGAYLLYEPNGDFGYGNQMVKTAQADGGLGWTGVKGTATVTGFWGTADDLWLIGDNSNQVKWQLGLTMHGTRPAGSKGELTWKEVDSQSSVVLQSMWGAGPNDLWAVGDKGTIRHISNGSSTQWEIVASGTSETLHSVWGSAANDVWAVGESGTILHFDGVSWKPSVGSFPINKKRPHLYGVWGSAANDVWIVGDGVALHHDGARK